MEVRFITVQVLRDIVIIIYGITGTVCFVLVLFMMFSVYKQFKVISNLTADSLAEIKKLINETKEAIKLVVQIIGIMEAACKGIDLVRKIFGIEKGEKENEQGTVG